MSHNPHEPAANQLGRDLEATSTTPTWVGADKREVLVFIQGARAKLVRLQTLIKNHYKNGAFDTAAHQADALALLDQTDDMIKTARNELS